MKTSFGKCKRILAVITVSAVFMTTGCGKQEETVQETEVLVEAEAQSAETLLPKETQRPVVISAETPSPEVTQKPIATETPSVTTEPTATKAPKETATPGPTQTPTPAATPKPEATQAPASGTEGKEVVVAENTNTVTVTEAPAATETPAETPTVTEKPVATPEPTPVPAPVVTPAPAPCSHNFVKDYWPSGPSCTHGADWVMVCSLCGEEGESGTDPALDHTPETVIDVDATYCNEHGIKITNCTSCGAELGREGFDGAEHDWVTGTTDPVWSEEAQDFVTEEHTYCRRCGAQS